MGLSGAITAGQVVAQLALDNRLDGHYDEWRHPVASVTVAGLDRGHDRAAAAAKTANLASRRAISLTAGGQDG